MNLEQSEVERMVEDAERHREEGGVDCARADRGQQRASIQPPIRSIECWPSAATTLPVHEKARAENVVAEARRSLKEQALLSQLPDSDRRALQQVYQIIDRWSRA